MNDYLKIDALVNGIIYSDNATKQNLGRRFAAHLGLIPGPQGRDEGIDGYGESNGRKIYFQCKLRRQPLGTDLADNLYANLKFHQADIGVMLAGVGYTQEFEQRLAKYPDIDKFIIHLLSLRDIYEKNSAFETAVNDLPPLRDLGGGQWEKFR